VRSSYHAADFRPELDILEDAEKSSVHLHGLDIQPEHLGIPAASREILLQSIAD
jgi:lipoic acid synthetase